MPRDAVLTDDELLALLERAEAGERELVRFRDAPEAAPERPGDACPHCGETALEFDECVVCEIPGCLPRDDWVPGWADPCLARCVRCALLFHADCGGVDVAGNPACGTCGPAWDPEAV